MNTPLPTSETDHEAPATPPTRRTRPMIGVAAGLLAGGAIGLVATMPSLTSAATDDGAALVDAAVVEQEDTGDSEPVGDADTDERHQRGDLLRETLQPLVDDGTINGVQADAVTEHLVENRPDRRWRRGVDGHGRNNAVLADLLGTDRETLRDELRAGNSIADIAEANGIEIQTVIDALIADAESHVDLAIAHGLDEDRAAERLARVSERIEEGVFKTRG